ncbi:MAG: hypothetical protein ACLGI9_12020, partial [Thermoanaerobaculia bacterium]
MSRNVLFYVAIISVFGAGILLILHLGSGLRPQAVPEVPAPAASAASEQPGTQVPAEGPLGVLLDHLKEPLSLLLLQVMVIVLAARLLGTAF